MKTHIGFISNRAVQFILRVSSNIWEEHDTVQNWIALGFK